MASSRSAVIEFNENPDAQSELQFQDFMAGDSSPGVATLSPTGTYTFPGSSHLEEGESDELLPGEESKSGSSFWAFSYYQNFFDVDTDQVLRRILYSAVPLPGRSTFLDRQIRPKPDLYGPFWIPATLICSIGILPNMFNFLMATDPESKTWSYDFNKVSIAASVLYSYVFLVPFIFWLFLWYRKSNMYTLLEMFCVYGYSLAIYVPLSFLLMINLIWLQWIFVIVGACLSGAVLIHTFWSFMYDDKKTATILLCCILVCHILFAVGFVTYFPRSPNTVKVSTAAPVIITVPSVSIKSNQISPQTLAIQINASAPEIPVNEKVQQTDKLHTAKAENLVKHIEKKQLQVETTTHLETYHKNRNATR